MPIHKDVTCPHCGEPVPVEITDEEIAEARKQEKEKQKQKKKDLQEFLEQTRNRDWEEKLKRTKEKEEKRKKEIEERFKSAQEHPEELEGGDEYRNPFEWE